MDNEKSIAKRNASGFKNNRVNPLGNGYSEEYEGID